MPKNNHNFWYLAGPMSGIPQFNFPLFERAAKQLRSAGYNIISPAEVDAKDEELHKRVLASTDGILQSSDIKESWGDFLSRDVKIIADKVQGIILLPGWEKSRGARLEAHVALLCGHSFRYYTAEYYSCYSPISVPVLSKEIQLELFHATD
jgi:hypothetical protein